MFINVRLWGPSIYFIQIKVPFVVCCDNGRKSSSLNTFIHGDVFAKKISKDVSDLLIKVASNINFLNSWVFSYLSESNINIRNHHIGPTFSMKI